MLVAARVNPLPVDLVIHSTVPSAIGIAISVCNAIVESLFGVVSSLSGNVVSVCICTKLLRTLQFCRIEEHVSVSICAAYWFLLNSQRGFGYSHTCISSILAYTCHTVVSNIRPDDYLVGIKETHFATWPFSGTFQRM